MKKTKLIISLLVAAIFVFVGLKYFDSQKEGVDEVKDIPKIIISNSYTAEKVAGADPETFVILDNYLEKDKNNVYLGDKIVKDADPMTITIAGEEKYKGGNSEISYLKDKSYVWRVYAQSNAEVLPNADPATF